MESNPIKRNENIAKLSRDHHASLMFCWKLRQGIKKNVSTERMIRYIQYFERQHFIPHFAEEEQILFSPLKDEMVHKAIGEHGVILRLVNEISFSGKENQQEEIGRLADLVDAHVRYEERVLFPHLEKSLSEEQLQEIGKKMSDEAIKDHYEDDFWAKNPKS